MHTRNTHPPRGKIPLRGIALTLITLNALDGILSLWTTNGGLDEYSPLWDGMLRNQPVLFMVLKLSAVVGLTWLLTRVAGGSRFLAGAQVLRSAPSGITRSETQVRPSTTRRRTQVLAVGGLVFCTMIYSALLGYHLWVLSGGTPPDLYDYRIVKDQ